MKPLFPGLKSRPASCLPEGGGGEDPALPGVTEERLIKVGGVRERSAGVFEPNGC